MGGSDFAHVCRMTALRSGKNDPTAMKRRGGVGCAGLAAACVAKGEERARRERRGRTNGCMFASFVENKGQLCCFVLEDLQCVSRMLK